MATSLSPNPLTAKPTDAIAPEMKGFDPAQQAVLKAEQERERYQAFQEFTKSDEQKMLAEGTAKATEAYAKEAQPKELIDQIKKKVEDTSTPFIPTQQTAGDLGTIFAITNILGFAIGRGAKGSAQAALSAQNGMLEGYQKGQMDVYKKQKDIFDENQKALSKAIEGLKYELTQAEKTASINKELAMSQVQQAIARYGADTLGKYINQFGIPKGVEYVKSLERMDKENQDRIFKQKEYADRIATEKARLEEDKRHHQAIEEKQTKGATQQQFVVQRSVNALGGVASAVEALSQLPSGTTVGILPNLTTKDGMINYMRNSAARSMTSSEAKAVETLFTGITRNLAAIEASGAATGLTGLSGQLEKLRPVAGDKAVDVALKMADIRRIAVENVTPLVESGLMPAQQAQVAQQLLQRIEKAIPYTTNEVVEALNLKGKTTIGEAASNIVNPGKTFETETQAEEAFKSGTLKSGEKVIINGRSGTWE